VAATNGEEKDDEKETLKVTFFFAMQAAELKCSMIFLHGYGSHCQHPAKASRSHSGPSAAVIF